MLNFYKIFTIVTLIIFIFIYDSNATDIWVRTTGNDLTGSGSINNPFKTIGRGIEEAIEGDIVKVDAGTYTGIGNVNLAFLGKAIEVRSINGPELTFIDCELAGQTRAFKFENDEKTSSILSGFTIKNGNANFYPINSGGAIFISASPTIENCIFENNTAIIGGAIQIFNPSIVSTPIIKNCTFNNNSTIENSTGGAINLAKNAGATIENCTFDSNFSDFHGGAISISNNSLSDVQIFKCIFQSNYTDGWGTIYIDRTSYVSITRNTFINNNALLGGASLATFNLNSNIHFSNNIIAFNKTTGIVFGNNSLPVFSCNNFYENSEGSFSGSFDVMHPISQAISKRFLWLLL